ncbi:MAG: hypothetical protein HY520_01095 [Candidatus Aenigmarchaeota archaeon]|nr:hypothetical protein [Candidatus Aenigmarchaeota archaeon]
MKRRRPARTRTFALFAAALLAGLLLGSLASSQSAGVWHDWAEITNIFVKEAQVDRSEICTINGGGISRPCPSYCAQNSYRGPSSQSCPTCLYSGNLNGYYEAGDKCDTSWPGFNHLCTADELARAASCGATIPAGWYATGAFARTSTGEAINDCNGWTSGGSGLRGTSWAPNTQQGQPSISACSSALPVLCCRDR